MTDSTGSFNSPDGPAVIVDPVTETPRPARGRLLARLAAVVVALGLAGGGAVLVLNAGSATGGADTPEAAVRQLLASLSNEDVIGAAEVVEPTERATLVDAGIAISDELKRLDVLSPEFDLSALNGVDLRFDNLKLRSVPVRADVARVFIDGGSTRASVDVAELPLGSVIADHVPADWLTFTDSVATPIASSTPIAVVKRSGRWYVSLWYTVAENARMDADKPMPSVADRPVPIGADSPEAAVERLMREALRLDPRTVIGMLDPEEMAALYDYAPLFLPKVESAANDALQAAADNGFEWSIDSISLSSTPDGDLASVRLDAIGASLTSPDVNGHLKLADGKVDIDVKATLPDYMGNPTTTTYSLHDGCVAIESDNPEMGPGFDSCDDQSGFGMFGGGLFNMPAQAMSSTNPADFAVITHKVDGKWFVSPIRTVTTAVITGLKAANPDDLAAAVDSLSQLFSDPFSGSVDSFGSAVSPSTTVLGSGDGVSGSIGGPGDAPPVGVVADFDLSGAGLLPADLPAYSAYDIPAEQIGGFVEYLAASSGLDLGQLDVRRAVGAFLPADADPYSAYEVTVLDLADPSRDEMATRLAAGGGELVATTEFGATTLIVLEGNRLITVGGLDFAVADLRVVAESLR